MKKLLKGLTGLMLLTAVVACGPGQAKKDSGEIVKATFPISWKSDKPAIKGGVEKVAIVSSDPSKGIFSTVYTSESIDSEFASPIEGDLFWIDGDYNIIDGGMANMKINAADKTVDVKFRDGLKWSDGAPLNVDDYIYTYEVLANKDYTGLRFDDDMNNIVGLDAYKAGKAPHISGLEKISDTELKIHFNKISPSLQQGGGGLCTMLLPKHYLSSIPVKDLDKSEKIRSQAISYGPYKLKNVVNGESAEYVVNENYWNKDAMPHIDGLIKKILPQSSVLTSMKAGEYDLYDGAPMDAYDSFKDFDNLTLIGKTMLGYYYIGFNLGHWDSQKGECVTDKSAKMYNLNLRKAIGYAINMELIGQQFYKGLRTRANSVIPPAFKEYAPKEIRFTYNPEKAKELLDKAGYKDVDGDGFREDPNGKKLVIHLAFPAGGDTAEPISQQYIQDLAAVGLKVDLTTGRLMNGAGYFKKLDTNSKDIDMFVGGIIVGSDIDPSGLYGRKSQWNISRLTSEENDKLIAAVSDIKGLTDPEYKKKAIEAWEKNYMENELGFLPTLFKYDLTPVNKRIKYITLSSDSRDNVYHEAVTAPQPYAVTK